MMHIYAIRDRLIDYYLRPFAANDDKEVMASIATGINQGDQNSALAQTPHHFEIWRLGSVTETGDIRPGKELIADCASLVRGSIRRGSIPGAPEAPGATEPSRGPTSGDRADPLSIPRTVPNAPPSASGEATEARQGH